MGRGEEGEVRGGLKHRALVDFFLEFFFLGNVKGKIVACEDFASYRILYPSCGLA